MSDGIKHNTDDIVALKVMLNDQKRDGSEWKSSTGTVLTYLSQVVLGVQYFPWYIVAGVVHTERDTLDDGSYNNFATYVYSLMVLGGAANAVLLMWYLLEVQMVETALPLCVGHVTWFLAVAILYIRGEVVRNNAPIGEWKRADAAFRGTLFRFFNVRVGSITKHDVSFTLFFIVGLVPAVLVGFLVRWFYRPRYVTRCLRSFEPGEEGITVCMASDGICCKMVDGRFELFTFLAYFTGNVLGAYKV